MTTALDHLRTEADQARTTYRTALERDLAAALALAAADAGIVPARIGIGLDDEHMAPRVDTITGVDGGTYEVGDDAADAAEQALFVSPLTHEWYAIVAPLWHGEEHRVFDLEVPVDLLAVLDAATNARLDQDVLDEAVYDATNRMASRRVNAGGNYDDEHDGADAEAGDINSRGQAAQVTYLLSTGYWTLAQLEASTLADATDERPSAYPYGRCAACGHGLDATTGDCPNAECEDAPSGISCAECGLLMELSDDEVSHHLLGGDYGDPFDADADHVARADEDDLERCPECGEWLDAGESHCDSCSTDEAVRLETALTAFEPVPAEVRRYATAAVATITGTGRRSAGNIVAGTQQPPASHAAAIATVLDSYRAGSATCSAVGTLTEALGVPTTVLHDKGVPIGVSVKADGGRRVNGHEGRWDRALTAGVEVATGLRADHRDPLAVATKLTQLARRERA